MKNNYVYIVRCADNSLYTGITHDLNKRINAHNTKRGAKFTRTRIPVKLVYYEECQSFQEAAKREYAIKKLSKEVKEQMVNDFDKQKLVPSFNG